MKKLIDSYGYTSEAFSLFRIVFYPSILFFYLYGNPIFNSNWAAVDSSFWQPISFFKFFSYNDFNSISIQALKITFIISMLASASGLFFRVSSVVSFLIILFVAGFPCNFGKIHHSNHMPVVIMGLMIFVPAGIYSLDSLIRKSSRISNLNTWRWVFFTILMYMSLVYFNAGMQKLRSAGLSWADNEALATALLTRPTVTELGEWVASSNWLPGILAKLALLIELFAPAALLLTNPWRFFYGFCLMMLHQSMYWLMGAHAAFFAYEICFLAWIPWTEVDKFLSSRKYNMKAGSFIDVP